MRPLPALAAACALAFAVTGHAKAGECGFPVEIAVTGEEVASDETLFILFRPQPRTVTVYDVAFDGAILAFVDWLTPDNQSVRRQIEPGETMTVDTGKMHVTVYNTMRKGTVTFTACLRFSK